MEFSWRYKYAMTLFVAVLFTCGLLAKPSFAAEKAKADPLAPRYDASLADGIDFKKPGYPNFLASVAGISVAESWGRWSDANLNPQVVFTFKKKLPKKFVLELNVNAYYQNDNKPIRVRIGKVEKTFVIKTHGQTYQLSFDNVNGNAIEIFPADPVRPCDLEKTKTDNRKLGLLFISLKIKE
jgi:hypothetical protein